MMGDFVELVVVQVVDIEIYGMYVQCFKFGYIFFCECIISCQVDLLEVGYVVDIVQEIYEVVVQKRFFFGEVYFFNVKWY